MAASTNASSQLLDRVSCAVCMEVYNNKSHVPQILPCQHTFCQSCIAQATNKDRFPETICCPVCRHSFNVSKKGFTTNRAVLDIAEISQDFLKTMDLGVQCKKHPSKPSVRMCDICVSHAAIQKTPIDLKCKKHPSKPSVQMCDVCVNHVAIQKTPINLKCKKHPKAELKCEECLKRLKDVDSKSLTVKKQHARIVGGHFGDTTEDNNTNIYFWNDWMGRVICILLLICQVSFFNHLYPSVPHVKWESGITLLGMLLGQPDFAWFITFYLIQRIIDAALQILIYRPYLIGSSRIGQCPFTVKDIIYRHFSSFLVHVIIEVVALPYCPVWFCTGFVHLTVWGSFLNGFMMLVAVILKLELPEPQ